MARPANPLDEFVTYTYHFELHAASSWDDLRGADSIVSEKATSRFASNGTLMINTRKDAHQVIDDVQFDCIGPATTHSDAPLGLAELKMTIKEPGGFSLIEKIKARMNELDVSELAFLVFGLKIIFVGRSGENEITIMQERMIPLCLANMTGAFTPEGGTYQLDFIYLGTMASTRPGPVGQHLSYAFTNKNVSFEANTVEEAFGKLEERLNANYAETYKHILNNDGGSKKLVYKIAFDPELSGAVAGVVKNSFAVDDLKKFSFAPQQAITSIIMDIIKRSPDLCAKIGATSAAMKEPLHSGAFMPIITPNVYPRGNEVEIRFQVSIYKGGGAKFDFDYFFADAGKNVDVHAFALNFVNIMALLATKTQAGTDIAVNFSGQLQTVDPKRYLNLVHEPVTQESIKYRPIERSDIGKQSGDVALPPAPGGRDAHGYNSMPLTAVPPLRLANNAFADFAGSIDPDQTMTIRGHRDLLKLCITRPDENDTESLVNGGGVWAKVNVFMPDENGKRQFFYTGYYNVYVITNIFNGGVFSQQLRMMMNEGF